MPGSCPFWLADTAGWKNSAGICSRGLEPSGEKGLGGAAGDEEEMLGSAQGVGTEHQPSSGLLNTGCETVGKSSTGSAGFLAVRARNTFGVILGRTGSEQNAAFSSVDQTPGLTPGPSSSGNGDRHPTQWGWDY